MPLVQPDPGPIVLPTDVAMAVKATLEDWVPYYLGVIDEQHALARGTTKVPSWTVSTDLDRWLEETPPAGLVVCPGTEGDPEKHGPKAAYGAWFRVNIGVTAGGATEEGSYELGGRLGGAVVYALAQQPDMGGLAMDTRWGGVQIAPTRNRKLMAAELPGLVYVHRIVETRGPLLPPLTPPDPPTGDPAAFPQPSDVRVRAIVTRGDE